MPTRGKVILQLMSQQLYRPAEACKMAEVAPYVLRYWETEFPVLSEGKEKVGPRSYTERDVKIIARIRELLYDEGFTVAGAKKRLDSEITEGRFEDGLKPAPSPARQREDKRAATSSSASPVGPMASPAVAVSEASTSTFLAEPESSRTDSGAASFPDRKRVVKELKEIVRILDRGRRK
jgi:DNA-binding transcriptional MerR regulator